jgi:homoserine kinase
MDQVIISVPATTANLGPGFDCLGLALELWNQTTFRLEGRGISVSVSGEGVGSLPLGSRNLIVRSFERACRLAGKPVPEGLVVTCENSIPLGSGLGSSAAAVVAGVAGANELLGLGYTQADVIRIASGIEGHADNAAAAVYGGLVVVVPDGDELILQSVAVEPMRVVVVLPDFHLPTKQARAALPKQVPMKDAVTNTGRTALVVEGLRSGDRELLARGMVDRLHQPYRLPLIPGAEAALNAAWDKGIPAALSGAGPSVIAFPGSDGDALAKDIQAAFAKAGLASRFWSLWITKSGIQIE